MTDQPQDEWGPWIEHDGRKCPVVGQFAHMIDVCDIAKDEQHFFGIAGSMGGDSWDWKNSPQCTRIIRYRIRKPRGMAILEQALQAQEVDA